MPYLLIVVLIIVYVIILKKKLNVSSEVVKKKYYSNGKVKSIIPYKNNLIDGIVKHYYENGNLQSKYYVDETHMENIGFWNEDGKEDELMDTYNKIMREVYKKSRRD